MLSHEEFFKANEALAYVNPLLRYALAEEYHFRLTEP